MKNLQLFYTNFKKFILILFFTYLFFFISSHIIYYIKTGHGFILGDWLINYDNSFKRRGLLGSCFLIIQDLTNLRLQTLAIILQITLYLCFSVFLLILFVKKNVDIIFLSLIFSPFSFLFYLNDSESIGRKEIILFLLFIIFTFRITKIKTKSIEKVISVFLIVLTILIHEMAFFYIPYFVILYLIKYPRDKKFPIIIFISASLTITLLFFYGNQINSIDSLNLLKERGVLLQPNNIFLFEQKQVLPYIYNNLMLYALYLFSLFIMYFQVFWCLKYYRMPLIVKKTLVFSFVFSVPLFFLAIDWGRWINIHMILIIVLLNALITNFSSEVGDIKIKYKKAYLIVFFSLPIVYSMRHTLVGFSVDTYIIRCIFSIL